MPSDLTELVIFDRLLSSFREVAEHCEALAEQKHRIQGERYVKLREHLMLIEGACRQAAMWREDWRWLKIGQYASECHKKCGDWLRFRTRGPMFHKLAENMRMMQVAVQKMKDARVGIRGPLVPEMPKYAPENRSVQVPRLIIPSGALQ